MPRIPPDHEEIYDAIKAGRLKVPYHGSPLMRFWSQVDKNGPVHPVCGQCWQWTGAKWKGTGYGQLKVGGERQRTNRYAYERLIGPITDGLWVLHHCDNRLCVNPAHLFLGTPTDNHQDMVAKERHARGSLQGRSKLTDEQVLEIRRRYQRYHPTNNGMALAREFGVSKITIHRIVYRLEGGWLHLD